MSGQSVSKCLDWTHCFCSNSNNSDSVSVSVHLQILVLPFLFLTLNLSNTAFFFSSHFSGSDSSGQRRPETKRRCEIRQIVQLTRGQQKNLRGWESTSITIATPRGESAAHWAGGRDQPAAWSLEVWVSRSVLEVLVWVRDDHRPDVIYLCWLVALSSAAWVALSYSIIHQTDEWLWQDAQPGGVCISVCVSVWMLSEAEKQNMKRMRVLDERVCAVFAPAARFVFVS